MKKHLSKFFGAAALLGIVSVLTAAVSPDGPLAFHERKEVAGLAVVFGVEPEPALTEEIQSLVWRMSSLETEEPYTELTDAEVVVTRDGEEFGPFSLRPMRGNPGRYQTRHIFTEVGEYETLLSFKKGEEAEVHTVDFNFSIGDRADMEIPKRRGGG
jgi:hypothetical protein